MGGDGAPEARRTPRVVRPYVLTQGRTKGPGVAYALESQVLANVAVQKLDRYATPEARRIVELCPSPLSIAELSAHLALPVGVVRILVGDLAAVNIVVVGSGSPVDSAENPMLLERLLSGIRAL